MKHYPVLKPLLIRLSTSVLLLFLLITVLFFLLRIAPGDPLRKYTAPELSPELNKTVREQFHLNEPVITQFYSFVQNVAQGELGVSFIYRRPVLEVILEFLPFTIIFSLLSMIVQLAAGYFSALYVYKKNKPSLDRNISFIGLILYSAPAFITGVVLILIFSELLNILPSSGIKSFYHEELSFAGRLMDYARHLVMPVITLSIGGAALFYNYLLENLRDTGDKPFVLNLKANGFEEKEIVRKHIVPNSLGPIISVASVEFGILLSGALITEVIFSLPGMGRLTVYAILTRDYPLVIGCSFFAGVMIILSNLIADFIKARIDRRLLSEGILN